MRIDVSAVTSHFPNPQDGFTTTTSGSVSSSATTVGLNSTGDYSNGDVVVLIIDPADADKKQVFIGTMDISGSQLTGVVWVGGTNQAHSSGATVVDYYDAAHVRMMTKGILVHANQDGTLKSGAVHSAAVLGSNVVEAAKIKAGAVEADKLSTSAITLGYEERTSNFTTTSTSATLVTGLSASVTIPSGGRRVKVTAFTNFLTNTASANSPIMTIWDGTVGSGTQVAQADFNGAAAGDGAAAVAMAILSPSAGAKTYNVGLQITTSGTAQMSGQATSPAFILVEAI